MSLILLIIAALVFVLIVVAAYFLGRYQGFNAGLNYDFRRPVNTFLFSKAPPLVQVELSKGLRVASLRNIPLPEEFDARDKWPDEIGEALDQGECGSCWAFSSATAIADRFRIAEPNNKELKERFEYKPYVKPPDSYTIMNTLSPYELVSCDICELTLTSLPITSNYVAGADKECDHGCEGGYITHVYKYIAERGITTMICTPPTCDPNDPPGTDCNCERGANCRVYRPRDVYAVFANEDDKETRKRKIMEDVYTFGPVTTGFTVYNSFYTFFDRNPLGVYTTEDLTPDELSDVVSGKYKLGGGHAVDVIGWGTDEVTGVFYWLVRNSWGPGWGDQGTFKIQYDWGNFLDPIFMAARI